MATKSPFEITKLEPRVAPTSGVFGAADSLNDSGHVSDVGNDVADVGDAANGNGNVSDVGNGNSAGNGNGVSTGGNSIGNVSFEG